jgi:replicative DNA helicase
MYQDQAAEWRLLTSFIQNPELMHNVSSAVFTEERQHYFVALKEAYVRYGELSFEVLHIAFAGQIPPELLVPATASSRALLEELARIARRRQLHNAATVLAAEATKYEPDERRVEKVLAFDPVSPTHDSTLIPGAQRMLGDLGRKLDGTYSFTRTGIRFLDSLLGGEWLPKTLNIVMAKPGTGKTALVGQSMLEMARQYQTRSLFFSLEMSKEQLISRWVAYLLSLDATAIQFGRVDRAAAARIEEVVIYLQTLPMFVIDDPTVTLDTIRREIAAAARQGCRVVFLDYLQIVRHHANGNRNQDLGEVAVHLKEIAKEHNLAVVLLSQMNKGGEGLDAVRDSGEVSQVADTVIEMSPIDEFPDTNGNRAINLRFHKNRNGKLAVSTVIFHGPTQKFTSSQ